MWPVIIGAAVAAAVGTIISKLLERKLASSESPKPPIPVTVVPSVAQGNVVKAVTVPVDVESNMVPVDLDGEKWLVARDYIGPIGIGEAADVAKRAGMELPSPALVDAIWRQADLKLLPQPRNNVISEAVFADQLERIKAQIAGRDFVLLGGSFKDVVTIGGFPQLYGWHVEDGKNVGIPLHAPKTPGPGKVIQPPSGKAHGLFYKDYSQGLRLVRRA